MIERLPPPPNGPLTGWLKFILSITSVLVIPIGLWLIGVEIRLQAEATSIERIDKTDVPRVEQRVDALEHGLSLHANSPAHINAADLSDVRTWIREAFDSMAERRDREIDQILDRLDRIEARIGRDDVGSDAGTEDLVSLLERLRFLESVLKVDRVGGDRQGNSQ